jgi:hypothetical protein
MRAGTLTPTAMCIPKVMGSFLLAFVQLDADGIICMFHCLCCMDPIMGGPQDAYSGKTIAVVGDITPMGVVFCAVPANTFHQTPVIDHVATAATIGTLLQQFHKGQVGIAAHRTLDPVQLDALARSRFWMLIPPCFVGEVLSATTQPKGLIPWDLWVTVVTPVRQFHSCDICTTTACAPKHLGQLQFCP